MRNFLALLTLTLSLPAAAGQPLWVHPDGLIDVKPGIGARVYRPAMDQLERTESGACDPDTCFDGAPILRREGPLAILEEVKLKDNPRRCTGGGKGGDRHCTDASTTVRQKVGIIDRGVYVKEMSKGGKVLGGGVGGFVGVVLAGVLGVFTAPFAIAALGTAAYTGIGVLWGTDIGGRLAAGKAEAEPRVFEREVDLPRD